MGPGPCLSRGQVLSEGARETIPAITRRKVGGPGYSPREETADSKPKSPGVSDPQRGGNTVRDQGEVKVLWTYVGPEEIQCCGHTQVCDTPKEHDPVLPVQ